MQDSAYSFRAGLDPDTAALTALLAEAGLVRPDDGMPLSEATVLGIGGGLGIGYILWEFRAHALRILVMGMRNNWQYALALPQKIERRLGVRFDVAETAGERRAQSALDAALAAGKPAMLWVDAAHVPYLHVPPSLDGACGHTFVACGVGDGSIQIDDRARRPFTMTPDQLVAARRRVPSYRNRLLTVHATASVDLKAAMRAGLADCAAHLAAPSDSFSLPVLRKWARLMTDAHNAKGWPRLFADGKGLFSTLASVFNCVSDHGSMGGSLRGLYADFLDDAAHLLGESALHEVAARYRRLVPQWNKLGEAALPIDVPELARARALITRRQTVYVEQGGDGSAELTRIAAELDSLRLNCDQNFPLAPARTLRLFEEIQQVLLALFAEETDAILALGTVTAHMQGASD